MNNRSNRAEVRNPILALPAAQALIALDPDTRGKLRALILELRAQAIAKADESMRKNKYLMFAYWRCIGVYCNHIGRALK